MRVIEDEGAVKFIVMKPYTQANPFITSRQKKDVAN
jgi:hypothetical protein